MPDNVFIILPGGRWEKTKFRRIRFILRLQPGSCRRTRKLSLRPAFIVTKLFSSSPGADRQPCCLIEIENRR